MTTLGTFILGLTTLPVALGLAWLASILWQATRFTLGQCRRGHRVELVRDQDDPSHTTVTGTTWECLGCRRSWRVVGSVGARGHVPTEATLEETR